MRSLPQIHETSLDWAAGDKLIWPPERVVAAVAAHCRRAELEARDREMYPELYAVGGAA